MLHCCQGMVWIGPVFIIDCIGILRLNGCAFSFIRVLACMTSWGSCGARVSISWKQQVIFVANSMWYFREARCVCFFVCVYVLVCVCGMSTRMSVCVFLSCIWVMLWYVVLCCILFWLDAQCAWVSVDGQFMKCPGCECGMLSYVLFWFAWMHSAHGRVLRGSLWKFLVAIVFMAQSSSSFIEESFARSLSRDICLSCPCYLWVSGNSAGHSRRSCPQLSYSTASCGTVSLPSFIEYNHFLLSQKTFAWSGLLWSCRAIM